MSLHLSIPLVLGPRSPGTAWGRLKRPGAGSTEKTRDAPVASGSRRVHFDSDAALETTVYHRNELRPGHQIDGPAVIEQLDSTSLVYPGDSASVDDAFNLIIELST